MSAADIVDALVTWTPFLAGGFVWNLVLSLVSMLIGTTLGILLALARSAPQRVLARTGGVLTAVSRNIPTFIMLFYLAYLLPVEVTIGGQSHAFPGWLKASLALSVAVTGFVSDTFRLALRDWRAGEVGTALLFIPNWTMYFVIIVMASSTASVVGVGEIVSRANTVIGAIGHKDIMLWVYLYAMLWFFAFCFPMSLLMIWVRRRMRRHVDARAATA